MSMNLAPNPNDSQDYGFIFELGNTPTVDVDLELLDQDFEVSVGRVANDEKDSLAFQSLVAHLDYAYENGQMDRLMQMQMTIGAMACNHDHMQEFATGLYDKYKDGIEADNGLQGSIEHSGHEHDDDGIGIFGRKKKKDKKKKKSKK